MRVDPAGPAKYLASMIPRNAFRESPSVTMVAVILQNANVRLSVVALAGCVLDCLSDQFVKRWRRRCCDVADGTEAELGEVLAVAALAISMKFLEDSVSAHITCISMTSLPTVVR